MLRGPDHMEMRTVSPVSAKLLSPAGRVLEAEYQLRHNVALNFVGATVNRYLAGIEIAGGNAACIVAADRLLILAGIKRDERHGVGSNRLERERRDFLIEIGAAAFHQR